MCGGNRNLFAQSRCSEESPHYAIHSTLRMTTGFKVKSRYNVGYGFQVVVMVKA